MCDDIDYKIGVMQAYRGGKVIEFRSKSGSWYTSTDPVWSWGEYDYRVKEEPKEDWVVEYIWGAPDEWGHYQALYEITESGVKEYIETAKRMYVISPTFRYRRIEPA